MAVALAMADHRFDGGAPAQLLLDLAMHAAFLARLEDPARTFDVTH
jgi:hypothetical protein